MTATTAGYIVVTVVLLAILADDIMGHVMQRRMSKPKTYRVTKTGIKKKWGRK